MSRFWVGAIIVLLCCAAAPKLRSVQPMPSHVSARVEAIARAICRARGINPDHVGPPYPQGPLWEYFIPDAIQFLEELDAEHNFTGPDYPVPVK